MYGEAYSASVVMSGRASCLGRKCGVTAGETHQAIEATFRIERARLIARLARMVRNVRAVYASLRESHLLLGRGSDAGSFVTTSIVGSDLPRRTFFHQARLSYAPDDFTGRQLSVGLDKLVYPSQERTGDIWLARLESR